MAKILKSSWRKLDNVAKIFSLDDKNNTNIFRFSAVLKQKINKHLLKKAVDKSLNQYKNFKVKIGTGLFWNYLELNYNDVIINEENEIPCEHIDFEKNNDYLFKVSYYNKKINLDIYHVLTDGTGAISFFKCLICNYLELKHDFVIENSPKEEQINYKDEYVKNYDKKLNIKMPFKSAYLIKGKINKNINNTYHYIVDIKEIKKVCKKYGVTITEYLTALYIYAIYLSIYKNSKKEIIITIPINLRKYYQVETLSNFFVCMNINPKILEKKLNNFDDILVEVHHEFQENLNEDKIRKYLSRDVKWGKNISIRLIPLFIKKMFMKYAGILVSKSATSTLSNVGIIDFEAKYKKYIDNVLVLVMPGRIQKIKCTICSFDKKLNITLNSNIDDYNFEQTFYKLLRRNIKNIKLESNNKVEFAK